MDKKESPQATSTSKSTKKKKKRKPGNSLLMFIIKWTFISLCFFSSIIVGLIVGYSVIGEGPTAEVFDIKIWKHLFELAFGS
jgi:ABC-type Na+ efflux pump permease subunit